MLKLDGSYSLELFHSKDIQYLLSVPSERKNHIRLSENQCFHVFPQDQLEGLVKVHGGRFACPHMPTYAALVLFEALDVFHLRFGDGLYCSDCLGHFQHLQDLNCVSLRKLAGVFKWVVSIANDHKMCHSCRLMWQSTNPR